MEMVYRDRPRQTQDDGEIPPGKVRCPRCGRVAGCLFRVGDREGLYCAECVRRHQLGKGGPS